MEDLREKIKDIADHYGVSQLSSNTFVLDIIEEIIKPLCEKAFEAGQESVKSDDFGNIGYQYMSSEWLTNNLK
jgi:hypothetical protein